MNSYFSFDNVSNFLFKNWNLSTTGEYVGTCIGMFIFGLLLEFLAYLKVYVQQKSKINPLRPTATPPSESGEPLSPEALASPLMIPTSVQSIRKRRLSYHVLATFLHVAHLLLAFIVMLAVMSYNGYIAISVVISSGLGYFVFGAMRDVIQARTFGTINYNDVTQIPNRSTVSS